MNFTIKIVAPGLCMTAIGEMFTTQYNERGKEMFVPDAGPPHTIWSWLNDTHNHISTRVYKLGSMKASCNNVRNIHAPFDTLTPLAMAVR